MGSKGRIAAAVIGAGVLWLGLSSLAQAQERFQARLTPMPADTTTRDVTGKGAAAAVLAGSKLSITGSFEGLSTPATVARVHQGPATGVRGPAIGDLTVSKATSGAVTCTFELTAQQVESLRAGRLYVQIHSQRAPDGNLWGWLLR
jgi:hypothetical protein